MYTNLNCLMLYPEIVYHEIVVLEKTLESLIYTCIYTNLNYLMLYHELVYHEIVVFEKTLESPLDCKEIKPVHPKGNQS